MSDSELKSRTLYLHDALRKLSRLKESSKDEFLRDFRVSDSTLHNLQLVIESLTDIGNYILKRGGHKVPETRAEVFQLLCRQGFLSPDAEEDFLRMSRFRYLLVHAYAAIDLSQVYDILQEHLIFLKTIASRLIQQAESTIT